MDEPEQIAMVPAVRRGRGRPKGSGYERLDAQLVEEMHRRITEERSPNIAAAARELAPLAYGHGSNASKGKRLQRRYARTYPV